LKKITIFWEGFPVCGLLLNSLAKNKNYSLTVYATPPAVPFDRLEYFSKFKINYVSSISRLIDRLEKSEIEMFIYTGWKHKEILKFVENNRGNFLSVMAVDNSDRNSIRQLFGRLYFRLFIRKLVDYVLVPGASSERLMIKFGISSDRIIKGYYGAYSKIYFNTKEIKDRNFLFVGSLIKRKSVDVILDAFKIYKNAGGLGKLTIVGDGPLVKMIAEDENITIKEFKQPEEVANLMRKNRFLLAPSRLDHWATVLCEGARCGQFIITSKFTGASEDLVINGRNGMILNRVSVKLMVEALLYCDKLSENFLQKAQKISSNLGKNFDEETYESAIDQIANYEKY
tara:strand:+ start:3907 stop:4932 length:1026 start_codon:yes stop_codon:yes gene_type:complete